MIEVAFAQRAVPLPASAALYARSEVSRVVERLQAAGDRLTGVATSELLVVLGPAEDLPWTPCVRYFGRDERAPRLLLSTAEAPELPLDLLERALLRGARGAGPWLFDERTMTVIGLSAARRLAPERLAAWLVGATEGA